VPCFAHRRVSFIFWPIRPGQTRVKQHRRLLPVPEADVPDPHASLSAPAHANPPHRNLHAMPTLCPFGCLPGSPSGESQADPKRYRQEIKYESGHHRVGMSGLSDQLEAFSQIMDFEVFRPDLEQVLVYSDESKGGRPPFDPVLIFKILVIQTLNNLSDERTKYLINDRLSFIPSLVWGCRSGFRIPKQSGCSANV